MNSIITDVIATLKQYNIETAYLFGSFSSETYNDNSDLDIAVLDTIDFNTKLNLINSLSKTSNRDIDLIELNKVNTAFQTEIVYNGKVLVCNNDAVKEEYEMKLFSNYLTLEEDRSPVINGILERGSIY